MVATEEATLPLLFRVPRVDHNRINALPHEKIPFETATFAVSNLSPILWSMTIPISIHVNLGFSMRRFQDQRVRPPIHAYPIDQPFQQERFVVNQIFPPHMPVQVNDYPVIGEYSVDVPIPLLPIIHDQPIDWQFELHHLIHEELTNQRHFLPVVTEMAGDNERTTYDAVGGEEQLAHRWPFLDAEAGEPDQARSFNENMKLCTLVIVVVLRRILCNPAQRVQASTQSIHFK
ncbi:hypothetical protein JOM56_004414 [Amanita muscaria]